MSSSYSQAGVDISAATRAKDLMTAAVKSTHGPAVLAGMGSFGGCFDLSAALSSVQTPVLVSSSDGVGTKTLIASALQRYDTVGQDLVNHSVNDILVQGAKPLFFLDYIAAAKLDPEMVAAVVGGVAAACREVGCALVGGETAEMPTVYAEGAFDLAGTIVGIVSRETMLPRPGIAAGDVVLALTSSGLHTNGYSLARRIVAEHGDYHERPAELDGLSIGEALLAVHRPYLAQVSAWQAAGVPLKGLAHITGGGLYDNLPRVLPEGLGAAIERGTWPIPPIFAWLVAKGNVSEQEAFHVFNMGLGMLAIVPAEAVEAALAAVPEANRVGVITGETGVRLV